MKFRLLLFALLSVSVFADDIATSKYTPDKKGVLLLDSVEVTAATDATPAKVRQRVELVGSIAGAVTITGSQRTFTAVANTSSGTIAAGCYGLTFVASSDFAGTIATNFPITAGASYNVPLQKGDTSPAIAFTRSAGTLYTLEVR